MIGEHSQVTMLTTQLIGQSSQDYSIQEELNENPSIPSSDHDLLGVWCHDEDISDDKELWYKMRNQLFKTFTYVCIFDNQKAFHHYFRRSLKVNNIFFIVTGKHAKSLCSLGTKRKFNGVYEFQMTSDSIESSSPAFVDVDELFKQIDIDRKRYLVVHESSSTEITQEEECHRLAIPLALSVFNSSAKQNSFQYWTKESLEFYRFQALTGILTKMNCDHSTSLKDMMRECRRRYFGKSKQEKEINDMEDNYEAELVIWYYTCDSFFFRAIGQVLRSEDIECMFKFRRCIIDLHCQIDSIAHAHKPENKTLYRGKKLRPIVLQQLEDNIGAFLSINGFLSATQNRERAIHIFAGASQIRADYKSVLFELSIEDTIITRPFAEISWMSQFQEEEEVLFTLGSVWQIGDVSLDTNDNSLWVVQLKSCKELNYKLVQFFKQLPGDNTFLALGDVLHELGQYTKAKNFYHRMLKESNLTNENRVILHYKIAMINMAQKNDFEALEDLHKAEKLLLSVTTNTEPSIPQPLNLCSTSTLRLRILYNMGLLYQKTDDYHTAVSCLTEASRVEGSNLVDNAVVQHKLGLLLSDNRKDADALKYLGNAVTLLAQDHPYMAKFKEDHDAVMRRVSLEKSQ